VLLLLFPVRVCAVLECQECMSQKPYLGTREGWWVNKYDIDRNGRLYNSSENGEGRLDRERVER
jgi:hypothetical protein